MNLTRAGRGPLLAAALTTLSFFAGAADYRIDVTGSVSWERFELTVGTALDLASAGLKLPTGRSQAEEIADMEFPRLARPAIFGLPVDSGTTVGDIVESGALGAAELGAIAASARRSASVLSTDLATLTTTYRIDLRNLAAGLVKHSRPVRPPKTLAPRPTRAYTGIIVYADEELPLHGTRSAAQAEPCFFPKLRDGEMNLLYERNMVEPEIVRKKGLVLYGFRREDPAYEERVGKQPLRVLATGLFGARPTDPIIDRDDALKILSSEENRALLTQGRVVIVLSEKALRGAR